MQAVYAEGWRKTLARLQPDGDQGGHTRGLRLLRTDAVEKASEDKSTVAPDVSTHVYRRTQGGIKRGD